MYFGSSKTSPMAYDVTTVGGTAQYGTYKYYDEKTGILILDAGIVVSGNSTGGHGVGIDLTNNATRSNGYCVLNASKNPALTGFALDKVAMRAVSTSAPVLSGTNNTLTWDSILSYDTHGGMNTATGTYTAPKNAIYHINCMVFINTKSYTSGQAVYLAVYKNGVFQEQLIVRVPAQNDNVTAHISSYLRLVKGDTIHIVYNNQAGSASLGTNSNFLAITEI